MKYLQLRDKRTKKIISDKEGNVLNRIQLHDGVNLKPLLSRIITDLTDYSSLDLYYVLFDSSNIIYRKGKVI